jgi:hypothetical protein
MQKYRYSLGPDAQVHIQSVHGDLIMKGYDGNELIIKTLGDEEPKVTVQEGQATLEALSACTIYVPHKSKVEIGEISGDAGIKSLDGELVIGSVGKELTLRDVGSTTVNSIGLDLVAKRIRGDLKPGKVGRAVIVRDVDGQFAATSIGAQLSLRDVSGGVTAVVGGNADITLAPVPWQLYDVTAGGNINCRLMEETSADFVVESGKRLIVVKLPDHSQSLRQSEYQFSLGEGDSRVRLKAGGAVEIRASGGGWESFGMFEPRVDVNLDELDGLAEQIEQQVTSQIEEMTGEMEAYLDKVTNSLRGAGLSEREVDRVQQRVRRAQERAQRAQDISRRKMALKLEAAQRRIEQKMRRRGMSAPPPPPRPESRFAWPIAPGTDTAPVGEPVSDEERLMILKMLEEQKISVEEAEQLLGALEGKAS